MFTYSSGPRGGGGGRVGVWEKGFKFEDEANENQ